MSSESNNSGNVRLVDVTARYMAEHYKDYMETVVVDAPELPLQGDLEYTRRFVTQAYTSVASKIKEMFDIELPVIEPDMIKWVKQSSGHNPLNTAALIDPISGRVYLFQEHLTSEKSLLRYLTHEMVHFASQRKYFESTRSRDRIVARIGLCLNGKKLYDSEVGTHSFNYANAGNAINEALTEIIASEVLSQLSDTYDFISDKGESPESYAEARQLYHALVDAIVLSWNNPDLVEKTYSEENSDKIVGPYNLNIQAKTLARNSSRRNRKNKLQQRLGWNDLITVEQVEALFHKAYFESNGLTKIAPLLNICLGDGAFEIIWKKTEHSLFRAWQILHQLFRTHSLQRRDIQYNFLGKEVWLSSDAIQFGVYLDSFPDEDGVVKGLTELLDEINRMFSEKIELKAPLSKDVIKDEKFKRALIMALLEFDGKNKDISENLANLLTLDTHFLNSTRFSKYTMDFANKLVLDDLDVQADPIGTFVHSTLFGRRPITVKIFKCQNYSDLYILQTFKQNKQDEATDFRCYPVVIK